MSDEQQEQQEVVAEQQKEDPDYSSSDEEEWLRPSADQIRKQQELDQLQQEQQQQQQAEGVPALVGTQSGDVKPKDYSWDEDERALAGNDVVVTFEIENADGSKQRLDPVPFVMGVTIAHLKTHLEDQHKIPYIAQQMFMGDQVLIDPLSLNDLGFQPGAEGNLVRVVVKG